MRVHNLGCRFGLVEEPDAIAAGLCSGKHALLNQVLCNTVSLFLLPFLILLTPLILFGICPKDAEYDP